MRTHPSSLHYPIRAAARLTGLSVDTLRAWERRYEAVVPRRDERGRVYSELDVARLRRLAALVDRGHAIGSIATLSDAKLARLLEESPVAPPGRAAAAIADLGPVFEAIDRYDLAAIETRLNQFAATLTPEALVFSMTLPLLRTVGDRWAAGTLAPSQEHLVSAIVRSILGGLLRTTARRDGTPRVVMATPSGERHELGLLAAAVLASVGGAGVIYLGADLPASEVVEAACLAHADIVVMGVTVAHDVKARGVRELARLPSEIELWFGGAAAATLGTRMGKRARQIADLEIFKRLIDAKVSLQ